MNNKRVKNNENILPIKDLLFHCIKNWYWFIITVSIALGAAVYYILSTPPVYVRTSEILIKEEGKGKGGSNEAFRDFGTSQVTANAMIEVKALCSPGIMRKVIDRMGFETEYSIKDRFHDVVIYKGEPIKTDFIDIRTNESAKFTFTINPDSTLTLTEFSKNGKELLGSVDIQLGDTLPTPVGQIVITPTTEFNNYVGKVLFVHKKHINAAVNEFCAKLSASLVNENTSIVRLSIKDISTNRARDILNAIADIYNEEWLTRNNENTIKVSEFIQQRIDSLQIELNTLDREIASFQSKNKIVAKKIQELSKEVGENDSNKKLIELNTQLELGLFIKKYLIENADNKELMPTNTGIDIVGIEELISSYNTLLIKRDRYLANSSEANPIVVDCNNKLVVMYKSLNDAVDSYIVNVKREIASVTKEEAGNKEQFTKSSKQVQDIQGLLRQQKIKAALYLFLLQKMEETELSKEFEALNNRQLVPPAGSNTPIEPMQRQSILLALAIGIMLPIVVIFVREITNRKVRGRRDLEGLRIPFIGEIPFYEPNRKKIKRNEDTKNIIVKHGSRDVINEAFRVLRTNLEFMNDKSSASNVLILTSFNPGSGKTFLTMNIAAGLALKGAKVLVIDGDMRHGSASAYVDSPDSGLSDYLSKGVNNIDEVIVNIENNKNLDVIPIGSTPPNPTELLNDKRFGELIASMRQRYKYILIDCPPIDIVADTQIIEEHADRTIFVVRAGLLNRDMLDELEAIYDEKRLKGLSMILNGTYSGGSGYRYKYGYSYSYGYGYGYGYGYHYHKK